MKVWPPHLTQYKPQNHKSSLKKGKRKDKVSDKEIIGNNDESQLKIIYYIYKLIYRELQQNESLTTSLNSIQTTKSLVIRLITSFFNLPCNNYKVLRSSNCHNRIP